VTSFDDKNPIKRILGAYQRDLTNYVDEFLPVSFRDIPGLAPAFEERARQIASRMILRVVQVNARSWREAARRTMQGRKIYEALLGDLRGPVGRGVEQIIAQNAQLISSIPDKLRVETSRYALEQYARGTRSEEVAKQVKRRFPQLAKARVDLIARTEVSKASTAITKARSEDIGISIYQWSTSEDARVRLSHRLMDKVIVYWSDAPSPEALVGEKSSLGHYHAGDCPNCRCTPLPVVDLREIAWPARMYAGGRIQRVTLAQFKRLNSLPIAA